MSWGTVVNNVYVRRLHKKDALDKIEQLEGYLSRLEHNMIALAFANWQFDFDEDGHCSNLEGLRQECSDLMTEIEHTVSEATLARLVANAEEGEYQETRGDGE